MSGREIEGMMPSKVPTVTLCMLKLAMHTDQTIFNGLVHYLCKEIQTTIISFELF